MSNHYILTEDKEVVIVDLIEWAKWFETAKKTRIVLQEYVDDIFISTVFLGLDHQYIPGGPPLIFETLVFGGNEDINQHMNRYSTYIQAVEGHHLIVQQVKLEQLLEKTKGEFNA